MFFRSASFCTSSVMNLSASLPVPPYRVNTRGLKEPCSISITHWLYVRFFSFSLLLKAVLSFWFRWLFANGLNTLTSKNAFCPFCQKPRALKSNRASSDELALLLIIALLLSASRGAVRLQHHDIHPWEGLQIGLAHHHASCGQTRLSCTTLRGQHQNACHMDTPMEGTLVSTCDWVYHRIPVCLSWSFLTLKARLLTSLSCPSSLPDHLLLVFRNSYFHVVAVGDCCSALLWQWRFFFLWSWVVRYPLGLCCLDCIYAHDNQLFGGSAGICELKVRHSWEDRYRQTTFLHWQGEEKSFISGA